MESALLQIFDLKFKIYFFGKVFIRQKNMYAYFEEDLMLLSGGSALWGFISFEVKNYKTKLMEQLFIFLLQKSTDSYEVAATTK